MRLLGAYSERLKNVGHFRRGFANTLVLDITSRVISALSVILLIRQLSTDDYAYLVLFFAVGQFVGSSVTGGSRMTYLRTEAERLSRKDLHLRDGFLSCLFTQSAFLLAMVLIAMLVVAALSLGDEAIGLVAVSGLFAFGMTSTELVIARAQAHLRFGRAGLLAIARSLVLLMVATTAFFGLKSGPLLCLCSAVAVAGLGLICVASVARSDWTFPHFAWRQWIMGAESFWLTIYYVGAASFATIDVFLIAALLSKGDVAAYGAAQRFQAILLGALPALIAVFRVRTAQADILDSVTAQREMLVDWMRKLAVPAVLTMLVVGLAAPFLLPIVAGGRYPLAIPLFELLVLSAIVRYLVTPAPGIAMAQGRYRLLAQFILVSVGVNAVADVIMAQFVGVVGLVAVAVAIDLVLSVSLVRVLLGFSILPGRRRRGEPAHAQGK